jgi:hypothetical protein
MAILKGEKDSHFWKVVFEKPSWNFFNELTNRKRTLECFFLFEWDFG